MVTSYGLAVTIRTTKLIIKNCHILPTECIYVFLWGNWEKTTIWSLLFWDVTQRRLVFSRRRSETTYRSLLPGSSRTWPLKKGPLSCPEMSVTTNLDGVTSQNSEDLVCTGTEAWYRSNNHYFVHNKNWLVFITETERVYFAVRTESLYIIQVNFLLNGVNRAAIHYQDTWTTYVPVLTESKPFLRQTELDERHRRGTASVRTKYWLNSSIRNVSKHWLKRISNLSLPLICFSVIYVLPSCIGDTFGRGLGISSEPARERKRKKEHEQF